MTDPAAPDLAERVARAMLEMVARELVPVMEGSQEDAYGRDLPDMQFDALTPDWQEAYRRYAGVALEASHHAELVEALADLLTASQPQHTFRHVFMDEAQERARAALAKVRGR